ncbi:MAG: RNA polymerase-associated protein RapA, partial [Halomonas sp.]
MSDFSPGQRWISDGEAELGLGTVLNCDARSVTILFSASQETRTYNTRQAPLTRVMFGSGDRVLSADGWQMVVDDSKESDGLITYIGDDKEGNLRELPEAKLADTMQFDQARDRLLTGQVDRNDWFDLRFRTLHHYQRIEQHSALGFSGPRIDLIPHQLYIANEVANRHAPRVLLADEVGLGKTIEAGLILHRLLLNGRVDRALILVPDSLTHQWLVELLRRFSLNVSLLDETQSQAHGSENPFESAQLVLASQGWLFANPQRQEQALASQFDLLIVDEAHHLDWSEEGSGPGYRCVEQLSAVIPGLLLLTATPEQMGINSHFARLRLLDGERYHDLERFKAEESHYSEVARAIDALEALPGDPDASAHVSAIADDRDSQALLATLCNPEASKQQQDAARAQLSEALLDRHGTGRVMFRNSRRHVGGFPERRLNLAPLALPSAYRRVVRRLERDDDYLDELLIETGMDHPDVLIYPDAAYRELSNDPLNGEDWWHIDPRVNWLLEKLSDDSEGGFANEKVLVIAHHRETAEGLAEGLRVLGGYHAPVFHEDLSLIERDRAAAAFADEDEGVQVLVCSEIGSEGRNFQFCRHLVMFDMPQHPDQLEQRIGRLDRIGQRHAIELHIPTFEGSPGERLLRWYHEGMDAFSAPHGVGNDLFDAFGDALADALLDDEALDEIIAETRSMFSA